MRCLYRFWEIMKSKSEVHTRAIYNSRVETDCYRNGVEAVVMHAWNKIQYNCPHWPEYPTLSTHSSWAASTAMPACLVEHHRQPKLLYKPVREYYNRRITLKIAACQQMLPPCFFANSWIFASSGTFIPKMSTLENLNDTANQREHTSLDRLCK